MAERKKKSVVVALRPEISRELIAERAYYRWLARQCPISDGAEDWFAARAELERELTPARRGAKRGAITA